jgi:very-short-patch-repair endonuclease
MGRVDAGLTRRELEKRFREFLAQAGLPRPQFNAYVYVAARWFEIDCLWRRERLGVELDGRATHDTRMAFETDRLRDRVLQVAGWRVVRVTWRALHDAPAAVAADLRALPAAQPR